MFTARTLKGPEVGDFESNIRSFIKIYRIGAEHEDWNQRINPTIAWEAIIPEELMPSAELVMKHSMYPVKLYKGIASIASEYNRDIIIRLLSDVSRILGGKWGRSAAFLDYLHAMALASVNEELVDWSCFDQFNLVDILGAVTAPIQNLEVLSQILSEHFLISP